MPGLTNEQLVGRASGSVSNSSQAAGFMSVRAQRGDWGDIEKESHGKTGRSDPGFVEVGGGRSPELAQALNQRGVFLMDVRKDYDGAEHGYREALRCDSNSGVAHYNLGMLLCTVRKDHEGAKRHFREALRCDPEDQETRRALAKLQAHSPDPGRIDVEVPGSETISEATWMRCAEPARPDLAGNHCSNNLSRQGRGVERPTSAVYGRGVLRGGTSVRTPTAHATRRAASAHAARRATSPSSTAASIRETRQPMVVPIVLGRDQRRPIGRRGP